MTFKVTFVIIGFILAVAGLFLQGVMLIGRLGIEDLLQSTALTWSFIILIIGVAIILFIKREWLTKSLEDREFKISLYIFYGIGFISWLWGIIDLLA